ncbi:hypothetical protein PIB30_097135 [Stylosanthes scabra]|uniref:Uncharacterized protein n=1 Tax=Stylosanthes scabra TaxID=79078 RepID=A0ABU6XVB6_9FABA|nr:hypothetical protein [Stylosanthes scabra]
MITPPRDLFRTCDDAESKSSQPLYFEHHENLTSSSIPSDDGDLVLERTDLGPTVLELAPQMIHARGHEESDFNEESDSDESSNFKLADIEATSSKSLIKNFERGRLKIVEERKNYGRNVEEFHEKEEDMPRLEVVRGQRELVTQSKGKEADDARKGVKTHAPTLEAKDSQRTLAVTQINKGKQGEAAYKKLKKPVHTKLDFSHLKSTLDAISNRDSATSAPLEEQQSVPVKRLENTRENHMDITATVKKRRVV